MANLEEKIGEAIVEVGKETVSDLVRPTSKSIGDNIGLLVDGVMGWLGYWGKKQYFYDGIRVIIHADVVELPERHTAKQQGKISGMK